MKLFTKEIEQRLIKNFKANEKDGELDFKVVCKLFNPTGIGTWYLTELDPDTNNAYALCCLNVWSTISAVWQRVRCIKQKCVEVARICA